MFVMGIMKMMMKRERRMTKAGRVSKQTLYDQFEDAGFVARLLSRSGRGESAVRTSTNR